MHVSVGDATKGPAQREHITDIIKCDGTGANKTKRNKGKRRRTLLCEEEVHTLMMQRRLERNRATQLQNRITEAAARNLGQSKGKG